MFFFSILLLSNLSKTHHTQQTHELLTLSNSHLWTLNSLSHRRHLDSNLNVTSPLKLNHSKQCVTALQQGLALRHQRTSRRLADHSCRGQYKQRSPTPRPHSDSGERDRETVRWAPRGFIVDLHLHLHRRSSSLWIGGGVAVLVVICVMVFG